MSTFIITFIFWCFINSNNVFAKLFRYIMVIYIATQIWGDFKAFEFGSAFMQIICICILFSPKIISRLGIFDYIEKNISKFN